MVWDLTFKLFFIKNPSSQWSSTFLYCSYIIFSTSLISDLEGFFSIAQLWSWVVMTIHIPTKWLKELQDIQLILSDTPSVFILSIRISTHASPPRTWPYLIIPHFKFSYRKNQLGLITYTWLRNYVRVFYSCLQAKSIVQCFDVLPNLGSILRNWLLHYTAMY